MPTTCQTIPTLNKWNKTGDNLGDDMTLFGTPSQAHQSTHSFQHYWYTLEVDVQVTPTTTWKMEVESPPLCNTHLWAAKGLIAFMPDPWVPPHQTFPDEIFNIGHQCTMSSNMLRIVGSQGASIQQGATRFKILTWPMMCSTRNLDRTMGISPEGGNTWLTWLIYIGWTSDCIYLSTY